MSNLDTRIGPNFPTMAQIIQNFVAQINANIDPSFAIENDNILSQIIVILAQECSNMFDTLQVAYDVLNPQTATGQNLIDACQYIGVTKTPALATQVFLLLLANTETTFPANTKLISGSFTISNSNAIAITATNAAQASVQVLDAVAGNTYALELDDILINYISNSNDTKQTIALALKALVLSNTALFTAAIDSADDTQIIINQTTSGVVDYSNSFAIVINTESNLGLTSIAAYAPFLNSVAGNITIPAGSFNLSTTPIAGVSTTQPANGINGAPADSDQTLRLKRDLSLAYGGNRTIAAIQAGLLSTLYVQKAVVYDNTSDNPQALGSVTLLPHSIYAVVVGGYQVDIATSIYNRMSEGIQMNGSTVVALSDAYNNDILINFDYATQFAIAITINIVVDKSILYKINKDAVQKVQNAALGYIQSLNIGETMYMDSLMSITGYQVEYGIRSLSATYTILPNSETYNTDLTAEPNQVIVANPENISVTVSAT